MKRLNAKTAVTLFLGALLLAAGAALLGCDTDSPEGVVRNVGLIVEGVYRHSDANSKLVSQTSGATVDQLNVRQSGDQLEAIDNNGIVFRGTIGQVVENENASFTLNGSSTAGSAATISGTISVDGTQATMRGTWIEDTLFGTVFGVATVPTNAPPVTDPPSTNTAVSVTPALATISIGTSQAFTASGGSGNFTWGTSNGARGEITGVSGTRRQSATYTATSGVGDNTVVVEDEEGNRATATVRQVVGTTDDGGDDGPPIP